MADPNIPSGAESKKDTVRINLPAGATPAGGKRDTSAMATDPAKKETAMMGMPSQPKKETSRVAVPTTKPPMTDMPRPTVRLRREPLPTTPTSAPTAPTAARAQVPEMPRPTVKLKVEEAAPETATPPSMTAPVTAPLPAGPRATWVDAVLSLLAAAASVAVLGYLAFTIYK